MPANIASNRATRWLFGSAAAFNLAVGFGFLFARDAAALLMGVAAPTGSNILLSNMVGGFVTLFGVGYLLIARDPVRWRALIVFSAWGKLAAVACIAAAWIEGAIPTKTTLPALIDLGYAAAFFAYLSRREEGVRS